MDQTPRASPGPSKREPSLLPSPIAKEGPLSPHAEGYEGDKLHDMFVSSESQRQGPQASDEGSLPNTSAIAESEELDHENSAEERLRDFKPFFTVIEDVVTGEHHHPHVHYIFSDDDPDLLTNALLETLQPVTEAGDGTSKEDASLSSNERRVIVDLANNGQTVISARSLTSAWHVSSHSLNPAPTFDQSGGQAEAGLMLRIIGKEPPGVEMMHNSQQLKPPREDDSTLKILETVEILAAQFEEEMATLRQAANREYRQPPPVT